MTAVLSYLRALLAYLRNRAGERSTWFWLAVTVVAAVALYLVRHQLLDALGAAAASIIAGIPDHVFHRVREWTLSKPAVTETASPRSIPMSTFSDIAQTIETAAITAVEAYIANSALGVEEKAAVSAVLAAFNSPSITTALPAFEAVLKVIVDLKAQVAAAAQPAEPAAPAA